MEGRSKEGNRRETGTLGSLLYFVKPLPFYITTRVPPFLCDILYSVNSWRYGQR
jgi:hypothetical protein